MLYIETSNQTAFHFYAFVDNGYEGKQQVDWKE